MTAEKPSQKDVSSKRNIEKNNVRAAELFKFDREEVGNFRKICTLLSI